MAPIGPSGRATPKPRIAPSIPMEMTDARGHRVTRTGITPMNGMAAVTADEIENELEIDDLPYRDLDIHEVDYPTADGSQSTLELAQVESATNNGAIPSAGTMAGTSGLTKAQQRANAATAAKNNNKKAKATRPPQRPILFGMGRDRLILIGVTFLVLLVAIVAASYILGQQTKVNPSVTPTVTAKPIPSPTGFGDPTETPIPQPTNTAVPTPRSDVIAVNGWVQVTANLTLRSEASTSGEKLGVLRAGTNGHVIEGPIEANGYTWWKLDSYDGTNPTASGWCAGEFLTPIPPP